MNWQLDRPEPKLPLSYFWTWDHSTNWMLDDEGLQATGCNNAYLKRPESFIEDYRRLTDAAAALGVRGIIIWGFLRDSHGGMEYSKRVADYAASKGVAIMPGLGTTHYGGAYYEGDHPYCLGTFLAEHPDAVMMDADGKAMPGSACAAHPAYRQWLIDGTQWLYKEFNIGGINLENGDYLVDHNPLMIELQKDWPADDPQIFANQAVSYKIALDAIADRLDDTLTTYATYTGFVPGKVPAGAARLAYGHLMDCERPAMFDVLPAGGICQWTVSSMMRRQPLPLSAYMDDGAPAEAFENDLWPADLKPPAMEARSVGFLHQPSQWSGGPTSLGRYQQLVSVIKEAALRCYRSGLKGLSIHGEVTAQYVPWALNYLAFSHFIHWPEDNMRQFAGKTLAPVLGDDKDAQDYVELLARYDGDQFSEDDAKLAKARDDHFRGLVARGRRDAIEPHRMWRWLHAVGTKSYETETVSFF